MLSQLIDLRTCLLLYLLTITYIFAYLPICHVQKLRMPRCPACMPMLNLRFACTTYIITIGTMGNLLQILSEPAPSGAGSNARAQHLHFVGSHDNNMLSDPYGPSIQIMGLSTPKNKTTCLIWLFGASRKAVLGRSGSHQGRPNWRFGAGCCRVFWLGRFSDYSCVCCRGTKILLSAPFSGSPPRSTTERINIYPEGPYIQLSRN